MAGTKRTGDEELKAKKKARMEGDVAAKVLVASKPPAEAAEWLAARVRALHPDLSALEYSDKYIPATALRDTSEWTESRTLGNLAAFVKSQFGNMVGKKKASDERKFIVVMSASALRACDVFRATKELGALKVIKKNKLEADLAVLAKTNHRILAATPGRLAKVLAAETPGVKAEEVKIVIMDASWLDLKKMGVWDSKEVFAGVRQLVDAGAKVYMY